MGNFSRKNHAAQTDARKTDAPKDRATELADRLESIFKCTTAQCKKMTEQKQPAVLKLRLFADVASSIALCLNDAAEVVPNLDWKEWYDKCTASKQRNKEKGGNNGEGKNSIA